MRVETLVNLVKGELLNTPFISEVLEFTNSLDEVERGSCFFSNDLKEIVLAIKKGAYAVVVEDDIDVLDDEIAWIKVDSFKKAVIDIFRYENLTKLVYFVDEITAMIIKKLSLHKEIVVVNSLDDVFKALNSLNKLIVVSNEELKSILVNVFEIEKKDINLTQSSLFKSLYYDKEINLPYVYKDEFSKAIRFFEIVKKEYSLDFSLDRFKPVFINASFEKVAYGQSDRVLIYGIKNDEYFFKELNYIVENTKHLKTIFVNEKNKELLYKSFNVAVLVDFDFKLPKVEEKGLF